MKLVSKILSLTVLIALAICYSSCKDKDNDKKTTEELQLDKLKKATWTLQSANDGTDRTNDFPNLKLTISGAFAGASGVYNYSFTGTRPNPSPWPVSGTWKFGTPPTSALIRDPGVAANETPMTYSFSNSDNTLTIQFNVPSGSTGWVGGTSRVRSVSGDWTFVFNAP